MARRRQEASPEVVDWIAKLIVGSVHPGEVVGRRNYGVLVRIGPAVGLCHQSQLAAVDGKSEALSIGLVYEFEILSVDASRRRIALRLLCAGTTRMAPRTSSQSPSTSETGTTGAVIGGAGAYASAIVTAVDDEVRKINAVGQQFAKLQPANLTGFVAEVDHAATFNVDGTFKRTGVKAERLASTRARSPDIAIKDKTGTTLGTASSKVYRDAQSTAQAQRGYGMQDRLVPTDQLDDVRAVARARATAEPHKGIPNPDAVAAEFAEVADGATDRLRHGKMESAPRTHADSRAMAAKARQGEVTGADIVGGARARMMDGAAQGAKGGAVAGAMVAGACEVVKAVGNVRRGETTMTEAAVQLSAGVGKGALEGGIKGAAGGAATAAAQVAAQRVGSQAMKTLLRGNAPAAAAVVGVDVAHHAIRLATGSIDVAEFRRAAADAVQSGAASYIGSAIGGAIGGPAGVLIGGVAGSMLASKANEVGLLTRLERTFSSSTTGIDGAEKFHLEQRAMVARALKASHAVAFFDRVIPTKNGGHLAVAAVVLVGDAVLAVDVRGWKGRLAFAPFIKERRTPKKLFGLFDFESVEQINTGEVDDRTIIQTKVSGGGTEHTKKHPNPLRRVDAASRALKQWLSHQNRNWSHMWIEPMVVFSGDDVELEGSLRHATGMATLTTLESVLAGESVAPPSWAVEDLATTPTWDVLVDPDGNTYQGIIQHKSFPLLVEGGGVDVPYASVFKVEVLRGGLLSRADEVVVTLRTGDALRGRVEKAEVAIQRMGYERRFLFRDLVQVCPSSYFTPSIG